MARDPIAHLQHQYADAVVRYDGDQWAATWAPDARWELGPTRTVEGRAAIVELWHSAMKGFHAVSQNVLNGTYDLDEAAGTGTGRWYIIEHYHRKGDGGGVMGRLLAYYDDTYVRVDGQWLFSSRRLVAQYNGPVDMSAEFLDKR
jgi:transposase-like protein